MKYRTIVADPPWPMPETGAKTMGNKDGKYRLENGREYDSDWWGRSVGRKSKIPYECMEVCDIKALEVPSEESAHLYLWTVNRHIESAYGVCRAWGFKPSQLLAWCKPPIGLGFGGAYCNTTEFVLFCRKGSLRHKQRENSTWWAWSRPYENGHISHSSKPEAFQDMVERVSPGPYLELFARRTRLGWATWGNECLCHVDLKVAPSVTKVVF